MVVVLLLLPLLLLLLARVLMLVMVAGVGHRGKFFWEFFKVCLAR